MVTALLILSIFPIALVAHRLLEKWQWNDGVCTCDNGQWELCGVDFADGASIYWCSTRCGAIIEQQW